MLYHPILYQTIAGDVLLHAIWMVGKELGLPWYLIRYHHYEVLYDHYGYRLAYANSQHVPLETKFIENYIYAFGWKLVFQKMCYVTILAWFRSWSRINNTCPKDSNQNRR